MFLHAVELIDNRRRQIEIDEGASRCSLTFAVAYDTRCYWMTFAFFHKSEKPRFGNRGLLQNPARRVFSCIIITPLNLKAGSARQPYSAVLGPFEGVTVRAWLATSTISVLSKGSVTAIECARRAGCRRIVDHRRPSLI
jgi:hypothetical protein